MGYKTAISISENDSTDYDKQFKLILIHEVVRKQDYKTVRCIFESNLINPNARSSHTSTLEHLATNPHSLEYRTSLLSQKDINVYV